MILIEIESYKGNTFLYGKTVTVIEFNKQIREIEKTYDKQNDNFIEQLCKI